MITVNVTEDYIVQALINRLEVWTKDPQTIELYEKMYTNDANSGCFDGLKINDIEDWAMGIVDNDWVNYTDIVHKGHKDFDQLLEAYKNGEKDVSGQDFEMGCYSNVEALSDDEEAILVRY